MRLPTKVHVGALTYRISADRATLLETCRTELTDLLGHTNHRSALIVVDGTQAECQKRDTLLHELLHTITATAGLTDEWGMDKDEQTVRRLTPHLLAALRDNPKLLAYLTAP